jgi:hypothetical protein
MTMDKPRRINELHKATLEPAFKFKIGDTIVVNVETTFVDVSTFYGI